MRVTILGVLAVWMVLSMSASAHHSHSNYEIAAFKEIQGVVTHVYLLNPHSWVYLDVKNEKGEAVMWTLEATGPRGLERRGIKREDVKVGEDLPTTAEFEFELSATPAAEDEATNRDLIVEEVNGTDEGVIGILGNPRGPWFN